MNQLNPSQNEQKNIELEAKKLIKTIVCLEAILSPINQILHDSMGTIFYLRMSDYDKKEIIKWDDFLEIFEAFEEQINDSMSILNNLDKKADEIEVLNKAKKSGK